LGGSKGSLNKVKGSSVRCIRLQDVENSNKGYLYIPGGVKRGNRPHEKKEEAKALKTQEETARSGEHKVYSLSSIKVKRKGPENGGRKRGRGTTNSSSWKKTDN